MARPPKLTQQAQEYICDAIAIGATYAAAAANGDVSYTAMRNWILAGEKAQEKVVAGEKLSREERRYLEFLEAVERAKADALLRWQQTIDRATQGDPAWAWKMLQVRAPNDYAPPAVRQEIAGKDGGPLTIAVVNVDVDKV